MQGFVMLKEPVPVVTTELYGLMSRPVCPVVTELCFRHVDVFCH